MVFRPATIATALAAALLGSSASVAQHQHGTAGPPMKPMTSRDAVPAKAHTGPLPPLPYEGYPSPRPMAVTQAAYEFAARHPEVLQYVPCFCGCERNGHSGNESCFVKARDASGRVTAWDSHGYG